MTLTVAAQSPVCGLHSPCIRRSAGVRSGTRRPVRPAALFGGGGKKEEGARVGGMQKEKMSREQYKELERQARGTAADFFGQDTKENIVKDYVDSSATSGAFLPLFFGIAALVILATVLLFVQQ